MDRDGLLLALETSGKSGSVALLRSVAERLDLASIDLPTDVGSAKTLTPTIDRLLKQSGVLPKQLTAIAALAGPGSFTGIRVGVATAKSMAYALQIPVIAIDTLDAIALQCHTLSPSIHMVLDAYRGQVFCAEFRSEGDLAGALQRVSDTEVLDIGALLLRMSNQSDKATLDIGGPGCSRIRKFFDELPGDEPSPLRDLATRIRWSDGLDMIPQAQSVARLGWEKWLRGEVQNPFQLQPQYYRASAAEEKRKQQ